VRSGAALAISWPHESLGEFVMRAEIETMAEEIESSVALLRRRL
jgi:hypothetical protein